MNSSNSVNLLNISFAIDTMNINVNISFWVIVFLVGIICIWIAISKAHFRHYKMTKMEISFGNIGKVEIEPNNEDIQIAHKIWTQLVTRKAAIQIDPKKDVIVEVYDSWYSLFTEIRTLISNVPVPQLKRSKSTQELVRIATSTLNDGLRPHLTTWQAKYRNWYKNNLDQLKELTPQELQEKFPEFDLLIGDMIRINNQMIEYANELKKMING